jgi:hypothetical protein
MSARIAGRSPRQDPFLTGEQWLINTDEPEPPMDPEQMGEVHDHGVKPGEHMAGRSRHEWGGFENGRIPAEALKAIGQGSHRLETSAADAWIAMREAAARDGVKLSLTDSYRDFDSQVRLRREKGHQVATATPGRSVHGWGRAVDANVNDPRTLAWLRANAGRFGWVNPAWAQKGGKSFEPWHWEFQGGSNG